MIINAIVGIVITIFVLDNREIKNHLSGIHGILIGIIVISIVLTAGLFAVCNYILKNKLNLE